MKRNFDDPQYKDVRTLVLKRDRHKCQMPNCGKKTTLQVHHIVPWSKAQILRFDRYNLIVLCKTCHKEVTGAEHIYEYMLSSIVYENEREWKARGRK